MKVSGAMRTRVRGVTRAGAWVIGSSASSDIAFSLGKWRTGGAPGPGEQDDAGQDQRGGGEQPDAAGFARREGLAEEGEADRGGGDGVGEQERGEGEGEAAGAVGVLDGEAAEDGQAGGRGGVPVQE